MGAISFRSLALLPSIAPVLLLLAWPAGTRAQVGILEVDGATLHYEVEGSGPALVLVHGWAHSLSVWDLQAPVLASDFQVIRYDRRGFGRSTGTADESMDPLDLAALLSHLGIENAYVLGWSQGALAATVFALEYPERVRGLILYGSPPPPDFGLAWTGPDSVPWTRMQEVARAQGVAAMGEVLADHPMLEGVRGNAEAEARVAAIWEAYSGEDFLNPVPPSGRTDPALLADLGRIAVPTLVLIGEREMPYFKAAAEALAYAIPGAEKVEVHGGGHAVSLVEPERFNAEVLRFLRRAEEASRRR